MKKIINTCIFIVYILNFSITSSQEYIVDYKVRTENTVDTTGIKSYLIFNNNKSLFVWRSEINKIENKKEIPENEEIDINFKKIINDTIGTRVYNDYSKQKFILREPLLENNLIVIDNKNNIDWKIEEMYMEIGGIKCQKAQGYFRGRSYIAWFTNSYPVPTGPWKLHGLPGLIIQAHDVNNKVNFTFKKLSVYNGKQKITISDSKEIINIKEFVKRKDNIHKEIINQFKAKLPRGAIVEGKESIKRRGIELSYEWE